MKTVRFFNLTVALLLLASLLGVQPAVAKTNPTDAGTPPVGGSITVDRNAPYVPGEVVVGFAAGQTVKAYTAQASALAGTVGAQVVDLYGSMALLSFSEDADVWALAAQLGGKTGVKFAEPNFIAGWIPEVKISFDPENPNKIQMVEPESYAFGNRDAKLTSTTRINPQDGTQRVISLDDLKAMRTIRNGQNVPTYANDGWESWGWDYVQAEIIWPDKAINPAVCVVDTGVDKLHPDLAGKILPGYNFVNADAMPDDDNGHGTHVTGTITANTNNAIGLAGVSTAKIVPVKVLNAQGWGTSFDIASGIAYCANNPAVKVINMSLGGPYPSTAEYVALQFAINAKGKLVAAAAGNDSTAWNYTDSMAVSFPAGWASPYICPNGSGSGSTCNNIYQALLAVGAGASPFNSDTWVDTNGDGVEDDDELYYPTACSAFFAYDPDKDYPYSSNFGSWVQIVAPGEDVWSTTPVSYPFWNQAFWYASIGYDSWSGTSMATPHVSGGAARAWSAFPTKTNAQIKNLLLNTGDPLTVASDPNILDEQDLNAGYNGDGYSGDAPFCWPDGYYDWGEYSGWYDMSNSVYLDVAAAMGRGALSTSVVNATTGLGIGNTTVTAYQGAVLRDTTKNDVKGYGIWFDLINLPVSTVFPAPVLSTFYSLKVANAFTSGAQTYLPNPPGAPVFGGGYIWAVPLDVAIPPKTQIAGVLNWGWYPDDLDLYVWLPAASSPGGVVGAGGSGHDDDVGTGTLLDYPRARWNRDGGWGDWMGMESISLVPKVGMPTAPWYFTTGLMPGQGYDFIVTDYGDGHLNQDIVFRYWVGGVIKAQFRKAEVCAPGEDWWGAGYVGFGGGTNLTIWDHCGTDEIWSYGADSGISSTSHK